MQFFLQNTVLPSLNSNIVAMSPKISNADKTDLYHPIFMNNFQFKIFPKILTDKLVTIAFGLISKEQKGFIASRNISECIYVASEVVSMFTNRSFGGNMAIKIDIRKTLDTFD